MLLDYLLPILQDSIITDKVRAVNHYLGKYQSQGNSQSEQLFVIYGVLERYHDLPKRTGTDFRGYRNGLSEYRNGLSGYRNGPERTGTDRNGLSWIPKRTL